jgi:hypothetical protein
MGVFCNIFLPSTLNLSNNITKKVHKFEDHKFIIYKDGRVDGRIILKRIFKKWDGGGHGLD